MEKPAWDFLAKNDHIKQVTTIAMIPLSGFHCTFCSEENWITVCTTNWDHSYAINQLIESNLCRMTGSKFSFIPSIG